MTVPPAETRPSTDRPSESVTVVALPLPRNWTIIKQDDSGRAAQCGGLCVIETVNRERDGRRWHHVSLSRASRLPTYEDVQLVRRLFIGDDVECYQVFPSRDRWVNRHPFCLHLWCCLDAERGAVLPDFRYKGEV